MDTIKLKRATKSVANASTKVLEKDEVLVITPDSGSGKGKCQLKFGDGVTATKSLPIAIDGENADETKVSTIPTISDENPVLSAGETVKVFFGKIKNKFTYLENLLGNVKTVTNLFGSNDAKTVAQGLQNLVNTKFNKSDLYDGTDSTSKSLGATANAVRKVNEKTDNNTSSISQLNSNLGNISADLNTVIGDINPLKSNYINHISTNVLNKVNLVLWDSNTADTPFKAGNTVYGNGFCITYSSGEQWLCQLAMAVGDSHLFTRHRREGVWSGWTTIGSPSS